MKIRIPLTFGLFAALLPLVEAAEPKKSGKPQPDATFFNGKDLTGWSASEMKYWSVKDGAIVGHSAVNVPGNKFIWADGKVQDFYLTVDVKLTPDNRNAGIQFRSKKANASGQAVGYQADVGAGVWGKLYHEHGRGKLDWNDNAVGAVKPGDWNRYEILAVGHKIWTAINGKLCVAIEDPKGELSGKISFQIHGGPAQTVLYRNPTLVHNPKIALEKQTEAQLLAALLNLAAAAESKKATRPNLPELFAASIHGSPNVDIAVPNGTYTLQLLLYEGWRSRSADIVIEGKTVRAAYDMFKEQGGNFDHGSVLRHTFTLTDGNIDIEIKGPLHLGGLILSKGKAGSPDRVAIVKSQAALDLKDVIKAINFGHTKGLNIGDVKFAAAAVNTTVDGVTNTAGGDVHSGEFGQQLPQIQKEKTALKNTEFFNGKDFTGWAASERKYWSIKDGAIVGHSAVNVPKNEFIWSDVEVKDFYLTVDVKLTPNDRNAGIQFRSNPVDAYGNAHGYQADVGHDQVIGNVWGNLYHEHGRGKLDWNDRAVQVVKKGDWNRYEILAVGHRIWTAINGKLCVAIEDPKGELSGRIAFQIHDGPPQTVHYRNPTLTHNPKIALEKQTEAQLLAALPKKAEAPKPAPKKPISTPLPHWTRLIMAVDPGSQGEAWAKPAFDHGKWKTMEVPGHFQNAGLPGHDGVVWFRKIIELSAEQAKSKAILNLGQIDDMDVTWINGKRVGGYENPGHHYTVRKYPITAGLLKTGKNAIAVRVMDHASPGGIAGKPEQLSLQLGKETVSLANLWHFAPGANLNALNKYAALANHALLRPLTKPVAPIPGFANGFTLKGNQSIVIVGGANAAECQRYGYLETLLASANPGKQLHVRNMAWAADTIYTQQRPRNFFATNKPGYGEKDRRPAMAADVLFVWFGQMESLEDTARLDDFTKTYIEILTQFSSYTGRLVLVTPVPAEDPLSLGFKVKDRNAALAKYASAIRQIARDRNLPLVDLFAALRGKSVTTDGLLLSEKGHQLAAQTFAKQLGFSPKLPANTEPLRQAILKKNALWQQYWFPSNWAFLYGNRQQTASSRSHINGSYRWFPEEIQAILPELEKLENAITKEAARTRQ